MLACDTSLREYGRSRRSFVPRCVSGSVPAGEAESSNSCGSRAFPSATVSRCASSAATEPLHYDAVSRRLHFCRLQTYGSSRSLSTDRKRKVSANDRSGTGVWHGLCLPVVTSTPPSYRTGSVTLFCRMTLLCVRTAYTRTQKTSGDSRNSARHSTDSSSSPCSHALI